MPFANHSGVFNPSDIGLLQRVFDQVCLERRLGPEDREKRDDLAEEILRTFRRGVMDETELKAALPGSADTGLPAVVKDPANPA